VTGAGAVPGATAGEQTTAPFSVTEHDIPKRSLAMPVALVAGLVALAGAIVLVRAARTPSAEPPAVSVAAASAPSATASAPAPAEPVAVVVPSAAPSMTATATNSPTPAAEKHARVLVAKPASPPAPSAKPASRPVSTSAPVAPKPASKPVDLGF
jgi:hypothetical protein